MAEELIVGLGERSYPIQIGHGVLAGIPGRLRDLNFPKRIALITNPTVAALYAGGIVESLQGAGYHIETITIPDGEEFKTLSTVSTVYDRLLQHGLDRGCGLIALGGGVVGDLAGFVAATFLRGIPFVQVPTTLLSQVDSSVGGKTGVNHPLGKNLIGAFYQPQLVIIDLVTLRTLEQRDYSSGLAEVVKYGMISDAGLFASLVESADAIKRQEPEALIAVIRKSCQIKADIVERDERESGVRAYLNFGHTYGHAVETLAGYGAYRHGEAVAIGMVVAARMARNRGWCSPADVKALVDLLRCFDLPVDPPALPLADCLDAMARDKKVKDGVLRMVLNRGIGACALCDVADPARELGEVLGA